MKALEQAVRLVVLGSGTSIPSGARSSSGYWLDDGATRVRLDCGSGSVHAMARFELLWAELDYQVFSHFHVDHFSDLPALLFALKWARSQARVKPLTLLGPRGLRERVHALDEAFGKDLLDQDFPVLIRELSPGDRFPLAEGAELEVTRAPHTEESLALKLTFGATSIGYTGDTAFSEDLCEFFGDVDVLVGECSFLEGTEGSLHLDARGLGELAERARARRLVVTHSHFDPHQRGLRAALLRHYAGDVTLADDGTRLELRAPAPVAGPTPVLPARDRASSILHRDPSVDYPEVAWAKGVWIHDRAGKAYLDASSGAAVSSLGHGNATVAEAMVQSARRVPYVHSSFFANSEAEELADLLTQRSPAELDHVVFSSTGSEAVEVALKLAKQYYAARGEPARSLFIARRHSYHGGTLATLAVGHAPSRKRPFEQLLTKHPQIAPCYAYRNQQADESPEQYGLRVAGELQATLDRVGRERVLAFVAETVSGSSLGAVPAVPNYFRAIREICTSNDILLILDEVMCGLYRCGSFAAFEEEGIAPDIFCIGKGLAAGYQPLAATVASRRVVRRIVDAHGAFAHQGTFMDHSAACGAGLATQRYILEHELEPLIRKRGKFLQELLMARCAPLGIVGDVRGRGLLRAVEFVSDRPTRRALGNGEFARQLRQRAIEQGLLVYPGGGGAPEGSGDHVLLAPPFIVQEAELEQMVDRLVRAIEACDRPPAAVCPPLEPVESLEAHVAEPARVHSLLNDTVHVSHSFVLENCYAKPSDTVVLASSLIEGMGNKYSDLDAYVFCERLLHTSEVRRGDHHRVLTRQHGIFAPDNPASHAPEARVSLIHTVVPGTQIKLDVEFRTFEEVAQLLEKVDELFSYATRNLELMTRRLTPREESLMHRIFRAVPISNALRFETLRALADPQRFSYLAYRWIASDFSVLLDIAGALDAGELDRAIELSRNNVLTQTQAYAHLHGVTNTDPKWLLFYLDPIFERHPRLRREFFALYHFEGVSAPDGKRRYVERSLDFTDELHRRARPLLCANPEFPSGKAGLSALRARFPRGTSAEDRFSELELAYRSKVYTETGLASSRLLDLAPRSRSQESACPT